MSMQKRPHSPESGYNSSDDHSKLLSAVQGMGRLNLKDDGIRNWQEEAIKRLDKFFPDWKNPKSSYMVPASFRYTKCNNEGQLAEKDIFDLLEKFGREYNEPMFVVHSCNFKEHCDSIHSSESKDKKWVKGEHDFVIIHKHYGVIFLQVKAKNERKKLMQTFKMAQTQIDKDQESINIFLNQQFKSKAKKHKKVKNLDLFTYPGFVVMPNCERSLAESSSLPISNVLFKEDCSSVESFRSWWLEKVANPPKECNPDVFEKLLVRFVALSYVRPPLITSIDHSHRQIVYYHTPQQLKIFMGSPPKQWITGPAGSGKTVLLMDKVCELKKKIKEAGKDERILVLVFNKPLRNYLEHDLNEDGVKIEIMTFMKFLYDKEIVEVPFDEFNGYSFEEKCKIIESCFCKLQSSPPLLEEKYEHIFVDEGQDLFNEHWPELLKLFHNEQDSDPLGAFYFWVMFDSNQHVQPGRKPPLHEYLKNASRLTYVLRNTENIFKLSKQYFTSIYNKNEEIKLGHTEVGLNIFRLNELEEDCSNCHSLLYNQIMELNHQGVKNKDIVILTKSEKESKEFRSKLEYCYKLQCQNAENFPLEDKIIVESIRRFKGLERKVVILLDPSQNGGNQASELMYVAVSRCRCYLIIMSTKPKLREHSGLPSENQSELEARFDYNNLWQMDSCDENVFGKNENVYESGPPETQSTNYKDEVGGLEPVPVKLSASEKRSYRATEEKRCRVMASQKESRPLFVPGKKILEPGDKSIPDSIREKIFNLLQQVVKSNLEIGTQKELEKTLVERLVAKIEHNVYKKHQNEGRSQKYTSELRKLKAEIQENNKQKQPNQLVWNAYENLESSANLGGKEGHTDIHISAELG